MLGDLGELHSYERRPEFADVARANVLAAKAWAAAVFVGAILLPAVLVFLVLFMRLEGRERWFTTAVISLSCWVAGRVMSGAFG